MINANLQKMQLFKDLSLNEIEHFMKFTGTTIKNYPRGERVLEAFVSNANIGVLVQGRAQILTLDRMGNETAGHSLECGAIFGAISAILVD